MVLSIIPKGFAVGVMFSVGSKGFRGGVLLAEFTECLLEILHGFVEKRFFNTLQTLFVEPIFRK
jgi:hypothetical protein